MYGPGGLATSRGNSKARYGRHYSRPAPPTSASRLDRDVQDASTDLLQRLASLRNLMKKSSQNTEPTKLGKKQYRSTPGEVTDNSERSRGSTIVRKNEPQRQYRTRSKAGTAGVGKHSRYGGVRARTRPARPHTKTSDSDRASTLTPTKRPTPGRRMTRERAEPGARSRRDDLLNKRRDDYHDSRRHDVELDKARMDASLRQKSTDLFEAVKPFSRRGRVPESPTMSSSEVAAPLRKLAWTANIVNQKASGNAQKPETGKTLDAVTPFSRRMPEVTPGGSSSSESTNESPPPQNARPTMAVETPLGGPEDENEPEIPPPPLPDMRVFFSANNISSLYRKVLAEGISDTEQLLKLPRVDLTDLAETVTTSQFIRRKIMRVVKSLRDQQGISNESPDMPTPKKVKKRSPGTKKRSPKDERYITASAITYSSPGGSRSRVRSRSPSSRSRNRRRPKVVRLRKKKHGDSPRMRSHSPVASPDDYGDQGHEETGSIERTIESLKQKLIEGNASSSDLSESDELESLHSATRAMKAELATYGDHETPLGPSVAEEVRRLADAEVKRIREREEGERVKAERKTDRERMAALVAREEARQAQEGLRDAREAEHAKLAAEAERLEAVFAEERQLLEREQALERERLDLEREQLDRERRRLGREREQQEEQQQLLEEERQRVGAERKEAQRRSKETQIQLLEAQQRAEEEERARLEREAELEEAKVLSAQRMAHEQRRLVEAQRAEDERRKRQEAERREWEHERQAAREEEQRRVAEERRVVEQERKAAERAMQHVEEERARVEAERREMVEEQHKAEQEAQRRADQEAQRVRLNQEAQRRAEQEAERVRRAEEEDRERERKEAARREQERESHERRRRQTQEDEAARREQEERDHKRLEVIAAEERAFQERQQAQAADIEKRRELLRQEEKERDRRRLDRKRAEDAALEERLQRGEATAEREAARRREAHEQAQREAEARAQDEAMIDQSDQYREADESERRKQEETQHVREHDIRPEVVTITPPEHSGLKVEVGPVDSLERSSSKRTSPRRSRKRLPVTADGKRRIARRPSARRSRSRGHTKRDRRLSQPVEQDNAGPTEPDPASPVERGMPNTPSQDNTLKPNTPSVPQKGSPNTPSNQINDSDHSTDQLLVQQARQKLEQAFTVEDAQCIEEAHPDPPTPSDEEEETPQADDPTAPIAATRRIIRPRHGKKHRRRDRTPNREGPRTPKPKYHTVTFDERPFGFALMATCKKGVRGSHIDRLTADALRKGLKKGFRLVEINDENIMERSHARHIRMLKEQQLPIALKFQDVGPPEPISTSHTRESSPKRSPGGTAGYAIGPMEQLNIQEELGPSPPEAPVRKRQRTPSPRRSPKKDAQHLSMQDLALPGLGLSPSRDPSPDKQPLETKTGNRRPRSNTERHRPSPRGRKRIRSKLKAAVPAGKKVITRSRSRGGIYKRQSTWPMASTLVEEQQRMLEQLWNTARQHSETVRSRRHRRVGSDGSPRNVNKRKGFSVTDEVETPGELDAALFDNGKWYKAKVVGKRIGPDGDIPQVFIHYQGWSAERREWRDVGSDRLRWKDKTTTSSNDNVRIKRTQSMPVGFQQDDSDLEPTPKIGGTMQFGRTHTMPVTLDSASVRRSARVTRLERSQMRIKAASRMIGETLDLPKTIDHNEINQFLASKRLKPTEIARAWKEVEAEDRARSRSKTRSETSQRRISFNKMTMTDETKRRSGR